MARRDGAGVRLLYTFGPNGTFIKGLVAASRMSPLIT